MNFFQKVYYHTKKIPRGKVASYGQIAALCGSPRAARQVGWALHQCPEQELQYIPWHRVINSKGFISTTCHDHSADVQKQLLEQEGVVVNRKQDMWWIDLEQFLWRP